MLRTKIAAKSYGTAGVPTTLGLRHHSPQVGTQSSGVSGKKADFSDSLFDDNKQPPLTQPRLLPLMGFSRLETFQE